MKRSIALFLAAVLMLTVAFAMTACGSDDKNTDSNSSDATEATSTQQSGDDTAVIAESDTVFTYNGTAIALDSSFQSAVDALGEPEDIKSETSCHGEGDDKIYTYADFVLKSYPKDGEDRVLEIVIKSEGVLTSKGVGVGSSLNDVTAAYGSDYNKVGTKFYSYNAGGDKQLRFTVKDDTVTEISYYYKAPAKP